MRTQEIPDTFQDLLSDETRAYVYLATVMADGSPQVTPVWFNTDGEFLLVNSARDRVKVRNMKKRPSVALCIADPQDPYRYLQLRGKAVAFTEQGAAEHIDALALKYTGESRYAGPRDDRVIFRIQVEQVSTKG